MTTNTYMGIDFATAPERAVYTVVEVGTSGAMRVRKLRCHMADRPPPAGPRHWRAGDLVSIPMHGGPCILRLRQADADDLNAGENPFYPWRTTGPVVLLEAAEEAPHDND